jgi:hypothetical protein
MVGNDRTAAPCASNTPPTSASVELTIAIILKHLPPQIIAADQNYCALVTFRVSGGRNRSIIM